MFLLAGVIVDDSASGVGDRDALRQLLFAIGQSRVSGGPGGDG